LNHFNWNISCSNGQYNSSINDTNGTKNLTVTGLTIATNYIIYVNTTQNNINISHWYIYTTYGLEGDFTYRSEGQTITVTPILSEMVESYRWEIEDTITGETEWIDGRDNHSHVFNVDWGTRYLITLWIRNGTLLQEINKYIKTIRDPRLEYDPLTGEPIVDIPDIEEPPEKFRNIFEDVDIQPIHIMIAIVISVFTLIYIFNKKTKKYYIIKKEKKDDRKK